MVFPFSTSDRSFFRSETCTESFSAGGAFLFNSPTSVHIVWTARTSLFMFSDIFAKFSSTSFSMLDWVLGPLTAETECLSCRWFTWNAKTYHIFSEHTIKRCRSLQFRKMLNMSAFQAKSSTVSERNETNIFQNLDKTYLWSKYVQTGHPSVSMTCDNVLRLKTFSQMLNRYETLSITQELHSNSSQKNGGYNANSWKSSTTI